MSYPSVQRQDDRGPARFITGSAGTLGAIQSFPDQKVLFRSDTRAPLSVVSQRFRVSSET